MASLEGTESDGDILPADGFQDQVIVYCDESGNSGPNYLDQSQPFYVLAGWAVPVDAIVEASVAVERIRREFCPQRDELKAAAFLRGEKQKQGAVELLERLGALHCMPVYLIAEKRFCVAGKIVETFLDPLYNKLLNNVFTADRETKLELANTLYERLPQDVLNRFAEAYRKPTSDGLRTSLVEIAQAAREIISPEMARCLEGSLAQISELAEAEATVGSAPLYAALNLPALIAFLMLIEKLGRQGLFYVRKLVHDEQHAYQAGYKEIFAIHRGAKDCVFRYPDGTVAFSKIRHIGEFETASSESRPLVQASDVLAGVVNHLCTLAATGSVATPADLALAELTIPAMFIGEPQIVWVIGSNHFIGCLGRSCIAPLGTKADELAVDVPRHEKVGTHEAPVLPVAGGTQPGTDQEDAFKVDVPLFGLVGERSGCLMTVGETSGRDQGTAKGARYLLLFTSRKKAEDFLAQYEEGELTEKQEVHGFGPSIEGIGLLLNHLEEAAQYTDVLLVDPGPETGKLVHLRNFAEGLRKSTNRMLRAVMSGFDRVLIEKHNIGGTEVVSLLTSSGKYVAMIPPDGKIYSGETREAAIEALKAGEHLQ